MFFKEGAFRENTFFSLTVCFLCLCLVFSALPLSAASPSPLRLSPTALHAVLCQTVAPTEDLLAYLALRYNGDLNCYRSADLRAMLRRLQRGRSLVIRERDRLCYGAYHAECSALLSELSLCALGFPLSLAAPFTLTKDFGMPRAFGTLLHTGQDLFAAVGSEVFCMEEGILEEIGSHTADGGYVQILSHSGTRRYRYAHIDPENLTVGQRVFVGQPLGRIAANACQSTCLPPHLHLSLTLLSPSFVTRPIDPYPLLVLAEG